MLNFDERWLPFIKALRAEGVFIAILTNNFYIDRARRLNTLPLLDNTLFDAFFESCRLGMRKPEERIYTHVVKSLKVLIKKVLYIHIYIYNILLY